MTSKWPWPADSPLDIARRLLQSYRSALKQIDPEGCRRIDNEALQFGQGWVSPRTETVDENDLVSASTVGEIVGVTSEVIRQWASRGYIPRHQVDGRPRYRVGDVLTHVANTRQARSNRRSGQRTM
ncbi:MAG: hypothetical protein U5O16_23545 [Rhodococcus sp. (in: high G+C Gram-positive bacteria)]|uniref:hypothetical protein n=1 Tax=Rhodococcus sp. TaxID=1831 RepID=UPI002ADB8F06|nr:hypothetical protein [Rhodococcus sp. (in: high G+C Gram-positive bacteria)]